MSHERQKWLRREGEEPLMDDPESPADKDGGWVNRRVFDDDEEDEHINGLNGFERVDGRERSHKRQGSASGTSEEERDREKVRMWSERRRNGVQKELGPSPVKESLRQVEVPPLRSSREWLYERDDLKWPAGDGWKPLS